MTTPTPAAQRDTSASNPAWNDYGDVVELALLLPATQAEALLALARHRRQTVGQLLRHLIDQALAGAGQSAPPLLTSIPFNVVDDAISHRDG